MVSTPVCANKVTDDSDFVAGKSGNEGDFNFADRGRLLASYHNPHYQGGETTGDAVLSSYFIIIFVLGTRSLMHHQTRQVSASIVCQFHV